MLFINVGSGDKFWVKRLDNLLEGGKCLSVLSVANI